jgi:ubiquinone/menaquinone biosynthesis C-methylase UbiE
MTYYRSLARDGDFRTAYNEYQKRYADNMKESDKISLECVAGALHGISHPKLLDIGCSTGNFLKHVLRTLPHTRLTGIDLADSSLALAQTELPDISFQKIDMLDLPYKNEFDVIVASAVAVYLTREEYKQALKSVSRALKRHGTYIAFEWLHPHGRQYLEVTEITPAHPEGLRMHVRPFSFVAEALQAAGMGEEKFLPFHMPFDLPLDPNIDPAAPMLTYTVQTSGERLSFRGAYFQPWHHLTAKKL